jgi:hypothetical protein
LVTAEPAARSPIKKKPFGSIQDHVRDLQITAYSRHAVI